MRVIDLGKGVVGQIVRNMAKDGTEWFVFTDGVITAQGSAGGTYEEAEADMRARVAPEPAASPEPEPVAEPAVEPEPAAEPEADDDDSGSGKKLKGKLPDGFPGKAALDEAGYGTYAKVRKLHDQGKLTEVPGIGEVTAGHIGEALSEK